MIKLVSAIWPYALVFSILFGAVWALQRLSLAQLSKVSMATNLLSILAFLAFRKLLLPPSNSPAFPALAQCIFWLEFLMAGFAFTKVIGKICTSKPGGETAVDSYTVTSASIGSHEAATGWRSISRSDWFWMTSAVGAFVITFMILMSFRHLTYHP